MLLQEIFQKMYSAMQSFLRAFAYSRFMTGTENHLAGTLLEQKTFKRLRQRLHLEKLGIVKYSQKTLHLFPNFN
jgi:hypothetical protein